MESSILDLSKKKPDEQPETSPNTELKHQEMQYPEAITEKPDANESTQPIEKNQTDGFPKVNIEIKAEEMKNELSNSEFPKETLPQTPQALFREPSSNDPEAPDSDHIYFRELSTFRVQMNDWSKHHIIDYCFDNQPLNQEGLSRINKEITAMTRALPCEPSGAVFVSIDSSNLSRIKALISGTEDTPYEHGLYLFDIKLDGNYPNTPPKMNIRTNGNYLFRFNPNLYDTGFVCLSIINTWNGCPEEMWNPSYSTLLQVFLSIQALVMDNDVIQKEPGYEYMATNCCENQDYAGVVKYGNMKYAMIDMMRNPPDDFKDIIQKHFALKKEKIIESAQKWVKESENMGQGFNDYILACHNPIAIKFLKEKGPRNAFQECYNQLLEELSKLPSL